MAFLQVSWSSAQTFIALRTRLMTVFTVSRSSASVRKAWFARPIGAMSWGLDSCPVESVRLRTSGGTRCLTRGSLGNGRPAAQLFLTISRVSSGRRLPPPHRRSEERRVGKEGRSRWSAEDENKKKRKNAY